MRVGVAGLGVMGAAVAARLMEVGHDVTVWNRSPEKTKPLARCGRESGGDAGRSRRVPSEATITMLTDDTLRSMQSTTVRKDLLAGRRKGQTAH